MNDDELLTTLRQLRTKVPMTVPVEQIISRGRAVRARRRIPGLAAALGAAVAAVVAVTALLPGHQASHQPVIQLAAWTVVKDADGTVYVRIRQLRDPAGLQRKLHADGVPASVVFDLKPCTIVPMSCVGADKTYPQPGLCQWYRNQEPLFKVLEFPPPAPGPQSVKASQVFLPLPGNAIAMRIDPSALPRNAGIRIDIQAVFHLVGVAGVSLVMASQGCTGS